MCISCIVFLLFDCLCHDDEVDDTIDHKINAVELHWTVNECIEAMGDALSVWKVKREPLLFLGLVRLYGNSIPTDMSHYCHRYRMNR